MQYDHPVEEEGCFVFEVVNNPICVRSQPNILVEDKTRLEFEVGELVAADLIVHSSDNKDTANGGGDSNNGGPFLRLTDRSGWLYSSYQGQERMRRLPVERGLWVQYVDNFPTGQYLRRHPVISPDLDLEINDKSILCEPGTKLYCDAKVVHPTDGITFYRVQGTLGWVFDHKPVTALDGMGGVSPPRTMLLDAHHVRTGGQGQEQNQALWCYRALEDVVIRLRPSIEEQCMTREIIKAGETVAIDYIREDPLVDDQSEGPFLRLADGSGWLFEKKQGVQMMKNVQVETGSWELKMLNPPVGVGLRRHPIVCQDKLFPVVYPTGCMIQCDMKFDSFDEQGTVFYHVSGTKGWVFDRRGENMLVELLSFAPNVQVSMHDPWDPNFARGVAATVDNIVETASDDKVGTLTFEQSNQAVTIYVFCKSRTVVVAAASSGDEDDHRRQRICERNCTSKQLVHLLKFNSSDLAVQKLQNETIQMQKALQKVKPCGNVELQLSSEDCIDDTEEKKEERNNTGEEVDVSTGDKKSGVKADEEVGDEADEESLAVDYLVDSDPNEVALRKELFDLESIEKEIIAKRNRLLKRVKVFDDERNAAALLHKKLAEERLREMKAKEEDIVENEDMVSDLPVGSRNELSPRHLKVEIPLETEPEIVGDLGKVDVYRLKATNSRSQTSRKSYRSYRSSPRRRGYQCGECDHIFATFAEREDHCRNDHGIFCEVCDKVYKSFDLLDLHKDKENH